MNNKLKIIHYLDSQSNIKIYNNNCVNDLNFQNNKSNQFMNVVNLFELNKRIKSQSNNNIVRKDKFIFLKEDNIQNPDLKENNKTLLENLNDLIEKNSKIYFNDIDKDQSQILYRNNFNKSKNNATKMKFSPAKDYNNVFNDANLEENEKTKMSEKTIVSLDNTKGKVFKSVDSKIKSEDINKNVNLPQNLSFMKSICPNNSNNEDINKNIICVSLTLENNIPLAIVDFGKYLIKYIEKEENYRILFEKEFKKIKDKIKRSFEKNRLSDHCLLEYLLELWDKLEVSYAIRYKILMDFCKK